MVKDQKFIKIKPTSLQKFTRAGLTRRDLFGVLQKIALVETGGCWAAVTENFDGQLLSAGVLQWNYGQNSMQVLLTDYQKSVGKPLLQQVLRHRMPQYGQRIFSQKCLSPRVRGKPHACRNLLLAPADKDRRALRPQIVAEFTRLFESNAMIQVQMNRITGLMEKALKDARYLFGGQKVSPARFHWVLDVLVHQGSFGRISEYKKAMKRVRRNLRKGGEEFRQRTMQGILLWYAGLALSPDQRGFKCDWRYNLERWARLVEFNQVSDERYELFVMSWIRARIATGSSGRWQALAFQRRAKIALGVGSAAHRSVHQDNNYLCHPPQRADFRHIMQLLNFPRQSG